MSNGGDDAGITRREAIAAGLTGAAMGSAVAGSGGGSPGAPKGRRMPVVFLPPPGSRTRARSTSCR